MTLHLSVLAGTFLIGLATSRIALALAKRFEIIDLPNERSSHDDPTPRGGGVGILMALIPGAVAAALLSGACPEAAGAIGLLAAVAGAATVGFYDDRRGIGAGPKMLALLAASALAVWALGPLRTVGLPGRELGLGVLAWPLTVFWLAGFANGFNFMDGIDGIAALHAGLAALLIGVLDLLGEGGAAAWIAFPLSAACLSFLSVNRPKALLFMGDVGSLPVGLLLAALAVVAAESGSVPFPASFLVLGPFLFDTIFTLIRRALRGENVIEPHRSHLYQRLNILGWSHGRVTLLYGAWTVLSGVLALLYRSGGTVQRAIVLGTGLLVGVGLALAVLNLEKSRGEHERAL